MKVLYICIALFLSANSIAGTSDPYRLGLTYRESVINTNTVCGNTPGLTPRQVQLCSEYPHSVASAIQGMQIAIHECKEQFKNHKWNCSALETRNKMPHTSPFLTNANDNPETAFSFAIASAGVVHQVAHACSLGMIKECECPQTQPVHLTASQRKKFQRQISETAPPLKQPVQSFEKTGCSHNINYGIGFAAKFLDSTDDQDFVSRTRIHNNRVGRLVVANNMRKSCRCHGTSGSCSQKTCWKETPDFRAVGLAMKQKHSAAVKVRPQMSGNQIRESNEVRDQHRFIGNPFNQIDNLIYLDVSPDYCVPNPSINVAGTRGRYCNSTAGKDHPNSCKNLCCSRGYHTLKLKGVEQCRCRFHWCCYVNCEECEWEETVSVCN